MHGGERKKTGLPVPLARQTGLSMVMVFLVMTICNNALSAERTEMQFRKQPEVQQVKPHKPVKVKLHRNNKGEYSWDITGDNLDEIIRADRKLRKLLNVE